MAERTRYDSLKLLVIWDTHHRKGLSTPRLTIGEYCAIVTLDNWLDEVERCLFVDVVLSRIDAENAIVRKIFVAICLSRVY